MLLATGGEFRRWIDVLDPSGGFPLTLFSRIRSCLTTKRPKHYIFHSCSCRLTLSMLRWLKLTRVLQRAQNRKSTKAFGFLSAQIIWYWGVLVLYKKMDFARSWHWKNEKPGPTKAWTQYWQNNFSSRRGDHNTIHPLSVLKAPRPYILKKWWWVNIFNS